MSAKDKPASPEPAPQPQPRKISDQEYAELEHLVLSTIEKLVMAMHHIGDDEYDAAQDCLVQCGMNVSQIEESNLTRTTEGQTFATSYVIFELCSFPEWIRCYNLTCPGMRTRRLGHVWQALWPHDRTNNDFHPHCPICGSDRTFAVLNPQKYQIAQLN